MFCNSNFVCGCRGLLNLWSLTVHYANWGLDITVRCCGQGFAMCKPCGRVTCTGRGEGRRTWQVAALHVSIRRLDKVYKIQRCYERGKACAYHVTKSDRRPSSRLPKISYYNILLQFATFIVVQYYTRFNCTITQGPFGKYNNWSLILKNHGVEWNFSKDAWRVQEANGSL